MSRFFDGYGQAGKQSGPESPAYLALTEEVPVLAKALIGHSTAEGTCLVPPCSLILFLDSGILKFCLSPKYGDQVCFGVVQEPLYSLHGVERALEQDKFEWKRPGKGRRS